MEVVLTSEQRRELERLVAQATRTCAGGAARPGRAVECGRDRGHGACTCRWRRSREFATGSSTPGSRSWQRAGKRAKEPRRPRGDRRAPPRARPVGAAGWAQPLPRASSRRKCVPGSVSDVLRRHALKLPRVRTSCAHTKGEPRRRVRGEVRDSVRLYLNPPEPSFRKVKQRRTSAMGVSLEKRSICGVCGKAAAMKAGCPPPR